MDSRYVGGSAPPEMEIPKLLCLKRHPCAGHLIDLADYLSFRTAASLARGDLQMRLYLATEPTALEMREFVSIPTLLRSKGGFETKLGMPKVLQ